MNYTKIIADMQQLHINNCDTKVEESAYATFPYDTAYRGQNEAVKTIMNEDRCLLCSHTGSGKSVVFLTAAYELDIPTLIIEPRKFLQQQIGNYFNDFVLYGKSEYECVYADSAAHAPCAKTYKHKDQKFFKIINEFGEIEDKPYQCVGCGYQNARAKARRHLKNGVLIVNIGNFWMWRDAAKFIIIDEADEFFRSVSSGIALYDVTTKDIDETNENITIEILKKESEATQLKITYINDKDVIDVQDAKKFNTLKNHLEKIQFFQQNKEICFYYVKKTTKQVFVELQPDKINVLVDRLFDKKKLCLVTATPSAFV